MKSFRTFVRPFISLFVMQVCFLSFENIALCAHPVDSNKSNAEINPYLDQYNAIFPVVFPKLTEIDDLQEKLKIKKSQRDSLFGSDASLEEIEAIEQEISNIRNTITDHQSEYQAMVKPLIQKFGTTIPDESALKRIKRYTQGSVLMEFGTGNFYWSYLLRNRNVPVKALRPFIEGEEELSVEKGFLPTEVIYTMDISRMNYKTLLLNSPSEASLQYCFRALIEFQGKYLIYVGEVPTNLDEEDSGAVTPFSGSYYVKMNLNEFSRPNFFKFIKRNYELKEVVEIPSWPGSLDRLYVFQRATRDIAVSPATEDEGASLCKNYVSTTPSGHFLSRGRLPSLPSPARSIFERNYARVSPICRPLSCELDDEEIQLMCGEASRYTEMCNFCSIM